MNSTFTLNLSQAADGWAQTLAGRGFVPTDGGWRREGIFARPKAGWLILEAATLPRQPARSKSAVDCPGLWKQVGCEQNQRFVFETPSAPIAANSQSEAGADPDVGIPDVLVDWALASANGEIPRDWRPPESDLVAAWMPPGALTARAGCLVRQGELLLEPGRWAMRFPILPCVPAGLPADRRLALDLLAGDAQSQFRMIRVGWTELPDGEALVAAVDLTGAPHAELLFLAGLEGLTQTVAWLVETADILADVTVTLRALEVCRV